MIAVDAIGSVSVVVGGYVQAGQYITALEDGKIYGLPCDGATTCIGKSLDDFSPDEEAILSGSFLTKK